MKIFANNNYKQFKWNSISIILQSLLIRKKTAAFLTNFQDNLSLLCKNGVLILIHE